MSKVKTLFILLLFCFAADLCLYAKPILKRIGIEYSMGLGLVSMKSYNEVTKNTIDYYSDPVWTPRNVMNLIYSDGEGSIGLIFGVNFQGLDLDLVLSYQHLSLFTKDSTVYFFDESEYIVLKDEVKVSITDFSVRFPVYSMKVFNMVNDDFNLFLAGNIGVFTTYGTKYNVLGGLEDRLFYKAEKSICPEGGVGFIARLNLEWFDIYTTFGYRLAPGFVTYRVDSSIGTQYEQGRLGYFDMDYSGWYVRLGVQYSWKIDEKI